MSKSILPKSEWPESISLYTPECSAPNCAERHKSMLVLHTEQLRQAESIRSKPKLTKPID